MIDSIKDLFDVFSHYISQAESLYVVESSLILFGTLLLDLFQRKNLKAFRVKAKPTKIIWDDVFLEALSKPISFIIWILSISYVAELIQAATKKMLFYELFAPAREVGIVLCLVIFVMRLISKAEKNILIQSEVSDKTTVHALA